MIQRDGGQLRNWFKLFRIHQSTKNLLVFIPLLASHSFAWLSVFQAASAFIAFSLAASGVYVLNDLVDVTADRQHSTKKKRPLAAGTVRILSAVPAAIFLMIVALAIAVTISHRFAGVVLAYLALTTAYSFWLKRKMLVDVVTLTLLYTIRVLGGAVAISVPISEWLLGFSMFIFTSLALIKRYVELVARLDARLPELENRNYRKGDLDIIGALAASAGFNAVTVFALYISSRVDPATLSPTQTALARLPDPNLLVVAHAADGAQAPHA